jgi:hypothetical protein
MAGAEHSTRGAQQVGRELAQELAESALVTGLATAGELGELVARGRLSPRGDDGRRHEAFLA